MPNTSRLLAFTVASLLASSAFAQQSAPPSPPPPPPAPAQPAMPPPPAPLAAPAMPAAPAAVMPPPPASPPSPADNSAAQTPLASDDTHSTTMQGPGGETVTINTGLAPPDQDGPKPAFAQLDTNHDGYIEQSEAAAYPPLENDWIHVAHHGKRISKAQYSRWH